MRFHASKIISALILLNTSICLAMQRGREHDPYKIGIESATCENRVYDIRRISLALKSGLQNIIPMDETNKDLDILRYIPQPTEVMPSDEKFYVNSIQGFRPNDPTDYVVFSRSGKFAKVVSRVPDGKGFKYIDCVASKTTLSPQQLQPIRGIPGQRSGRYNRFGIGITSVSCEGRVYDRRNIFKAIEYDMKEIARSKQSRKNSDVLRYKPKPTEVMPSNEKYYLNRIQGFRPHGPEGLVIFSRSGQFAKVVIRKEDRGKPYYEDCVSSSNKQYPERSSSGMVSPERLQLRIGSPEPPQLSLWSSKRRRLRTKSPEQEPSA